MVRRISAGPDPAPASLCRQGDRGADAALVGAHREGEASPVSAGRPSAGRRSTAPASLDHAAPRTLARFPFERSPRAGERGLPARA